MLRRQSLRGEQRLCFLFIGAASRFAELPQRAGDRDLGDLFRFFPYQERSALKLSLGVPDAGVGHDAAGVRGDVPLLSAAGCAMDVGLLPF